MQLTSARTFSSDLRVSAWSRLRAATRSAVPTIPVFVLWTTLFKGWVLTPADWALSHHLLNYSHGLVRRGTCPDWRRRPTRGS